MKIVLIGSGKVGRALGHALKEAGHQILMISGRNSASATQLAEELNSSYCQVIDIPNEADIYILAVTDDSISEVSEEMSAVKGIVAHCSGGTELEVIGKKHSMRGVLYPLDSFSNDSSYDLRDTPILIEGETDITLRNLQQIGATISDHVFRMDSGQREQVHLAAVFYNNFIYHISSSLKQRLSKHSIDTTIFNKLVNTTLQNLVSSDPHQKQTGPAARNDNKTIEHHLEMLRNDSELFEIYHLITNQILKRKGHDERHKG